MTVFYSVSTARSFRDLLDAILYRSEDLEGNQLWLQGDVSFHITVKIFKNAKDWVLCLFLEATLA